MRENQSDDSDRNSQSQNACSAGTGGRFAEKSNARMKSDKLTDLIVDALDDLKGQDIVKLDVRDMTTVTDYMVLASGTSNRHVQALVDNVAEKAKAAGHRPIGIEGEDGGEWVLLDLQDALVHVMLPKVREFYNLEKLWSLHAATDAAATDR